MRVWPAEVRTDIHKFALAAGGMNAAGTPVQAAKGIKDDWKAMYDDTMKGGHNRNQPELVELMTRESAAAAQWLAGRKGDRAFLWVHLYDTHAPYAPPFPFDEAWAEAETAL